MRWTSVRVRLTLWNVAVIALVLGGFGLGLCYSVQANLQLATERELKESAYTFAEWRARRDREGRSWPPGPPRARPAEGDRPPTAARTGGSFYYRRPRVVPLDGKPIQFFWEDEPWDTATFLLSRKGEERFSTVVVDKDTLRVFSMPLRGGKSGQITGVVQVAHPLTEQKRLTEGQLRTFMAWLPLALLVAAAGGIFLTDRALLPIRKMTQEASQLGAESLSQRLEVTGKDELADLAITFNALLGRLEAAFEQQRRFTADASHELRTPLARLKVTTSLALSGLRAPEDYREALEVADRTTDVMSQLVQDLLLLARSDAGQLRLDAQPLLVEAVLREAIDGASSPRGLVPRLESGAGALWVLGDHAHLSRLFSNLLENALRHTPPDGEIVLSAREEAELVEVSVRDTGEGIPEEHLPHLGERFYRADTSRSRSRGGTGLGLAICQSIVQAHGGSLQIESAPGRGTTVRVRLPRVAAPNEPPPDSRSSAGGAAPGTREGDPRLETVPSSRTPSRH